MKKEIFFRGIIGLIAVSSGVYPVCAQNVAAKPDSVTFKELYRPQYHLTPPRGYLFDPTALIYLDGRYIVNKGIASGTDLVHWKLGRPQRLVNDTVREMSGSAVIDSNNTSGFGKNGQMPLVAIYSGLNTKNRKQTQCIAYSTDKGLTWTPYSRNPVIDIGSTEFRDPQVFWYAKSKKWVMVVALAAERKIRFYQSDDLKAWTFMSDFGPFGATNGVWECPDFFRLPVKGHPGTYKWVLEVSVQPVGGQYFVGEFDGMKFTADPPFSRMGTKLTLPAGRVLFDFETGLAGWEMTGNAFSHSPAKGSLPDQNPVLGFAGSSLLNSFFPGDAGTGTATSPSFLIDRPFINFLVGGGTHPGKTTLNLVVDGKTVRTTSGTDAEVLSWSSWDVRVFKGKNAKIVVSDDETGSFGHIMVDQVMLGDAPAVNDLEPAFWLDYGPDFYAVRSWVNGPVSDERRVSIAWLGSWLYASKAPSSPWKGGHTFPRSAELVTQKGEIRLTQNPVKEIEQLRTDRKQLDNVLLSANHPIQLSSPARNVYELEGEFALETNGNLILSLCAGKEQQTVLRYDAAEGQLTLDRSKSGATGFSPSFVGSYRAPLKLRNGKLKLHILVDQSSIEVFANDGEVNLTCLIFPDPKKRGISMTTSGKGKISVSHLDLWSLKSIWD
jgi:sucrose-6-phosphate hydrolase SacC (GH32 family)